MMMLTASVMRLTMNFVVDWFNWFADRDRNDSSHKQQPTWVCPGMLRHSKNPTVYNQDVRSNLQLDIPNIATNPMSSTFIANIPCLDKPLAATLQEPGWRWRWWWCHLGYMKLAILGDLGLSENGGGAHKNSYFDGKLMVPRFWGTPFSDKPPCFRSASLKTQAQIPSSLALGLWVYFVTCFFCLLKIVHTSSGSSRQDPNNHNIYLYIYIFIYRSINLSIHLSIYPSIHRSIFLSVYLSICLSVYPSIYLYICLSVYLSIYLFIYLCIDLSVYRSVYLSVCLSISLSIYLSIYLSV